MRTLFETSSQLAGAPAGIASAGFGPGTRRIAVIGAGIAGLGCAYALTREHPGARVTLFEAAPRLGGHTNTVDVCLDGHTFGVDTGFLVFNERTYPHLSALFAELGVPVSASEMSFGLSVPVGSGRGARWLEWAGTSLATVFAQPRNAFDPRFLSMLRDIVRFNAAATALARGEQASQGLSLGEFLRRERYGESFRNWYLLPMAAAIWSCPTATMLAYPLDTFARFCHNHGLLQLRDRPRWLTVRGGARQYVDRIAQNLPDVRLADPVLSVAPLADGRVSVRARSGNHDFDDVVLACHSDQAAAILGEARVGAGAVASKVSYQPNRAVLHTDPRLMPRSRRVWSSWNYLSDGAAAPNVCVTYWLNRLQPLPFETDVFVTLNPTVEPARAQVIAEFDYAHPVFDTGAIDAQRHLPTVQGRDSIWLAGAWTGYGFHEDGLKSGLAVARAITARDRRAARIAELRPIATRPVAREPEEMLRAA